MSTNALALLNLAARSMPDGVNADEYVRRVPVGPARYLLRAMLAGDEEAVIEVPLVLNLSIGDLNRLLAAWTGGDDDVVLAAERAIRKRLDEVGPGDENPRQFTGQPEVVPNWNLMLMLTDLRKGNKFRW